MTKTIRRLHRDDKPRLTAMDTGIEDDYVIRAFSSLIEKDSLYGLFVDDQLAILGGYSVYANNYAMLGRLRSDRKFRGRDLATELVSHVINEIFQNESITWIGANTQENNLSARRVLEKLGLTPYTTLHGAITKDTTMFETGAHPWHLVNDLSRKRDWLNEAFIKSGAIFPYECYYPFPATADLFKDADIAQWNFYENDLQTRLLITKADQKKHHYLHTIYPWQDKWQQDGLWETIALDYHNLTKQHNNENDETYIWMDLTKEDVHSLPAEHKFELDSPWILHGIRKED